MSLDLRENIDFESAEDLAVSASAASMPVDEDQPGVDVPGTEWKTHPLPDQDQRFDVVVVGGGPCGATAANGLAQAGHSVLLLDKDGRIKPCGGAIPPRCVEDFDIPDDQLVARIKSALMVAPSGRQVPMPIDGGYVGMVDREHFDEWLRTRAQSSGATRAYGGFERFEDCDDGTVRVFFKAKRDGSGAPLRSVIARAVIGADGARSAVAKQAVDGAERVPCVFAYHEIVKSPEPESDAAIDADFAPTRCDVYYQGRVSPDFYGWVFPHGPHTSIGVGSANKGFSLRGATKTLREVAGLDGCETVRKEGAPIPLKPLKKWDNGRNVVVAGDAAGIVAPASGEGIYYAMEGGRRAADAVAMFLATGDARALATARKKFMKDHGRVFMILGIMQHFWYSSDKRRERFVSICEDPDVQRLTWQAYMNKKLVRADPMAHLRIFFKDLAHLMGLVSAAPRDGSAVQTDVAPKPQG
ncbi:MAG: geranylgeranyl diphosphate reductase [Pseudomonadota bacterium]